MDATERTGSQPTRAGGLRRKDAIVRSAVRAAIGRGYLVGRHVMVGNVPGAIVGYNIACFGRYLGSVYPLVVRTALGVTKCRLDELSLA